MDRRRFDDAISSLTACLALDLTRGVCYARRARRLHGAGEQPPGGAAADASPPAPTSNRPWLANQNWPRRGTAWGRSTQTKDYAAAIGAFEAALNYDYPATKGLFNLASVQPTPISPENAKASLRRVLVVDPTHAEARNLLTKLENRIKP